MNAILSIYAGAGGDDAQDWTAMLARMYGRWAKKKNKKPRVLDQSPGKKAGFKKITIEIKNAYKELKNEAGTHRLVRRSPFKGGDQRHTSFALVEVLPERKNIKINLKQEDLEIDTFRSTGPGGQHVNKRETAVRVTHLPTGLSADCQAERNQAQNKKKALQILQNKIHLLKEKRRKKKRAILKTDQEADWGYRRRSYVLYPYQLIKDEETGKKFRKVDDILNGKIDELLE